MCSASLYRVFWSSPGLPGVPGRDAAFQRCRRRFFDPRFWRVILVDQRGCGASTPRGRLEARCPQHPKQCRIALSRQGNEGPADMTRGREPACDRCQVVAHSAQQQLISPGFRVDRALLTFYETMMFTESPIDRSCCSAVQRQVQFIHVITSFTIHDDDLNSDQYMRGCADPASLSMCAGQHNGGAGGGLRGAAGGGRRARLGLRPGRQLGRRTGPGVCAGAPGQV